MTNNELKNTIKNKKIEKHESHKEGDGGEHMYSGRVESS
jgi:hypothetical protein